MRYNTCGIPPTGINKRSGRKECSSACGDSSAGWVLFRPLIYPGTNQTNLVLCKRTDVRPILGRRHEVIFIADMRHGINQRALPALAGDDCRAILAALQYARQAVEMEFSLCFFAAVAFGAGLVENRLDVSVVSQSALRGGGR